jgi:hypothetical protein
MLSIAVRGNRPVMDEHPCDACKAGPCNVACVKARVADEGADVTHPTWDDLATVKRQFERSRAEGRVLRGEIEDLKRELTDNRIKLDNDMVARADLRGSVVNYRNKLDEAREDIKKALEDAKAKHQRVAELERENGMLESQVARAQGRCVVIAGSSQAELMAQALVQVRDLCVHAAGARSDIGGHVDDEAGGPKLRQIHGIARRALDEAGAIEKSAKDIEKMRKNLGDST